MRPNTGAKIPVLNWKDAEEVLSNPHFYHVYKIKADIDLSLYRDLYQKTIDKYEFYGKDGLNTYDAISLQYNKSEGKDPYSDGVEYGGLNKNDDGEIIFNPNSFTGRLDGAKDRSDMNDLGDMWKIWFDYLEDKFPNIHLFRTRILRTKPGHSAPMHIDEEASRIHLPIFTNKYNIMWFQETPYYLPADGSIYLCNTGAVAHQFANLSGFSQWMGEEIARVHLVTVAKPKSRMYTNWA